MTDEGISSIPLPQEGADIAKKDITEDIILSDEKREEELQAGESAAPQGDHAVVTLLDIAFETGAEYCKKEGYPAPMDAVYKNFSRPFLNKAAWHYLPDEKLPESPEVALLLGVGGLVLAFSPTLIEVYKRRKDGEMNEEKDEENNQKEETKKEEKTELITAKEGITAPVAEAPIWMKRLSVGGAL